MKESATLDRLVRTLRDRNPATRLAGIHALGRLGDSGAVDPLVEVLRDADVEVCLASIQSLGQLGDSAAFDPLVETLRYAETRVRRAAAKSLGQLGDSAAVGPLVEALRDADVDLRRVAAKSLGWLGDSAAFDPLVEALRDTDSIVRLIAVHSLGALGDSAAVVPFITVLRDYDVNLRRAAAKFLGQLGDSAAVGPLVEALRDIDVEVRLAAIQSLGQLDDSAAVDPLIQALGDAEPRVLFAAAESLGKLGTIIAFEALTEALKGDSDAVRLGAAYALHLLDENKYSTTRSIVFPPEYKAAGLQVLNHFDDVIRSRYSDIDVKISITQEDALVTMTIETTNGEQLEKVEKTLEQYGLVVRGEMAAGEFLANPVAVIRLRNELRLAHDRIGEEKTIANKAGEQPGIVEETLEQHGRVMNEEMAPEELLENPAAMIRLSNALCAAHARIEMKEELLASSKAQTERFDNLLSIVLRNPTPVQVVTSASANPVVEVKVSQNVTVTQHITGLQGSLADLAESLPQDSEESAQAKKLIEELEALPEDPIEAKKAPVLARLRRLVEDLGDDKSGLGKAVKGVKHGARIAQDVAKRYNEVAQWVGWPQVPRPLLGRDKNP